MICIHVAFCHFLQNQFVYLSVQDPVRPPPDGYNQEKSASIWTLSGRQKVQNGLEYRMRTIFAGRIFRKRPAPNNIRDFDLTNGSLQLQTCTVCLQIFVFSFSRMPVDSRNSQKYSPAKICTHTVLPCCTVLYQNSTILHSLSVVCSNH